MRLSEHVAANLPMLRLPLQKLFALLCHLEYVLINSHPIFSQKDKNFRFNSVIKKLNNLHFFLLKDPSVILIVFVFADPYLGQG
ncbi:hypothetical protein Plhal304r1_c003g0012501 [Plasmopara halstedii]